jgi:hypothetical protein
MPERIVVFGQYKTGTTAVFSKLKNSLPADTRTLFEPSRYIAEAGDDERWVLSKTILKLPDDQDPVDYSSFSDFDRKVFIVRDPRDWLVSMTLFLTQEKPSVYLDPQASERVVSFLRQKEADAKALPLRALLEYILSLPPAVGLDEAAHRTRALNDWCIKFSEQLQDALVLRYEDFVDGRLADLEAYLGRSLSGSGEPDQAYAHVPRTRSHSDWKNWLLEDDVRYFRPVFADYMRYFGYTDDWTLSEQPRVRAAFGSEYVQRVIDRKRDEHARA